MDLAVFSADLVYNRIARLPLTDHQISFECTNFPLVSIFCGLS